MVWQLSPVWKRKCRNLWWQERNKIRLTWSYTISPSSWRDTFSKLANTWLHSVISGPHKCHIIPVSYCVCILQTECTLLYMPCGLGCHFWIHSIAHTHPFPPILAVSTAEKESESKASSQARATVWLGAWNRPGGGRSGQFMGPRGDPSNPEAPPVAVTSHDLTLFSTGVRSPRVSCFRQIASDRRQETSRRKRYLCILRERNSILTTLNKRSGHNYTSL